MIRWSALIFALAIPNIAFAQQADSGYVQRVISELQEQRNAALNAAVAHKANADGLAEQVAKLTARISELEKGQAPAK